MLYATDLEGNKQRASPNTIAFCPDCNTEMILKCGLITIWHWAHKTVTETCNYKPETEWHLEWKERATLFKCDVEVRIGNNIADILNNNSRRLIELQNSSINTQNMINRCLNYKKEGYMVDWMFNLRDKYENDQLLFTSHDNYIGFRQKWSKKQLSFLFNNELYPLYGRIWFDISENSNLFLVKKLYPKGGGYGVFADRNSPIKTIKILEGVQI